MTENYNSEALLRKEYIYATLTDKILWTTECVWENLNLLPRGKKVQGRCYCC